jgi:CRP-like cAMP-binding protein
MTPNKPLSAALTRNPLFLGLSPEILEGIISESHRIQGEKGQELFSAGDRADSFFYVISGWVKLYRLNRDGVEAVIHVIAPGETFAEAAVFGSHRAYPVNAQYIEDSVLLAIPRTSFVERIAKNPDLALHLLGAIAARQKYLIQQIEQLTVKDAPQRIGTFLLRLCQAGQSGRVVVDLPYDKSLISRRLNIQPETFSRAIKKLEGCGVTADGHKMIIGDVEKLAHFCEVEDRASLC